MAQIDDFTGANGDPIPSSYTTTNGSFQITDNAIEATGAIPSGPRWLALKESASDGVFAQRIKSIDQSTASGIVFRGSANGDFLFANLQQSAPRCVLFKYEGGTFTELADGSITSSAGNFYDLVVDADGPLIKVYFESNLILSHSTTFNENATLAGFRINQAGGLIDSMSSPTAGAAGNGIAITTPNYRVWKSTTTSITVDGLYTGTPTSIERNVDGTGWVTAVASPSGGVFSDTFTLSKGQHSIEYRFSNDIGVTATLAPIAIAYLAAGGGQSNVMGKNPVNNTFTDAANGSTAFMFGNDYNYKKLEDPWDTDLNQVDQISAETDSFGGSWVVRFAHHWLQNKNEPIGLIPCPRSGSSMEEWQKTSSDRIGGLNLYESLIKRANEVGGIDEVFYQQGERNARDVLATTKLEYKNMARTLFTDMNNDLGCDVFIVPLHTILDSSYDGTGGTGDSDTGQNAIRAAQVELAQELSFVRIGEPLSDIVLSGDPADDGLHFMTFAQQDLVGQRVYSGVVADNTAPSTPTTSGPTSGQVNTDYDVIAAATDDGGSVNLVYEVTVTPASISYIQDGDTVTVSTGTYTGNIEIAFRAFDGELYSGITTHTIAVSNNAQTSICRVTILDVPDGLQPIKIISEATDAKIYEGSPQFTNGVAFVTLPVAVGVSWFGRWLGTNPPQTGTGIFGVSE